MNSVIMIGNLAADPEQRTTKSGKTQCSFRIGVQRRQTNENGVRESDFFPVICWGKLAENCCRYLAKGSRVGIEGCIQTRSYDAQDGTKRYVTEILADNVEFLNSRNQGQQTQNTAPAQYHQTQFTEIVDDQLPF